MTLQSWPPMSTTVRVLGAIQWAPFAWQEISETFSEAKSIWSRP